MGRVYWSISSLLVSLFLAAVQSTYAADEQRSMIISAAEKLQTHDAAIVILKAAYDQIGVVVQFKKVPALRSLVEANNGTTDGDVARIIGTEIEYPNLIKVPTPIINLQGFVFSNYIDRPVKDWSDISDLKIGILRGVRYSDIGTKGMNRIIFDSYFEMFRMVNSGRIDVAVAVLEPGLAIIDRDFPNSGIVPLGEAVLDSYLYHYLHKKNADLIPALNKVFMEMEESGVLKELHRSIFE